ncbi:MAG: hypothetical protein AAFV88_15715 [Planctomycetota bacterium]
MNDSLNPYQAPLAIDPSEPAEDLSWDPERFTTARRGLMTIYACLLVFSFVFLCSLVGSILMGTMGSPVAFGFVLIVFTLAIVGNFLGIFIGLLMCGSVPRESRAAEMSRLAAIMQATIFVVLILGSRWNPAPGLSLIALVLRQLPILLGGGAAICFAIYLRRLNQFLRQRAAERSARILLWLVVANLVCYVLIGMVLPWVMLSLFPNRSVSFAVMGIPGLVLSLLLLVTYIKYASLVRLTARTIERGSIRYAG